jgi:hypothetical protein
MRRTALILTALLTLLAAVPPARALARGSSEPTDPRAERARVRSEQAAAAARLDALRADASAVEQALDALDGNVRFTEGELAQARQARQTALDEQAVAEARIAELEQEMSALRADLQDVVLRTLVHDGGTDGLAALLAADPNEPIAREVMSKVVVGDSRLVLDQLDAANDDLAAERERATRAAERAAERARQAEDTIARLDAAIQQQRAFSTEVDERIDATLAEAAGLEQLDARLSQQIQAREAAIAARLAARAASSGGSGNGGPVAMPTVPGGLVSVYGIRVSATIAPAIKTLVERAAGAGFTLAGGGYRSAEAQIAVRRNNCGSSQYDIWHKPASQCRPPAARPGKSLHEKGLAVDFTCNGSLVVSYGSDCYRWIAANAPGVGLANRRGEPWHWSPTGH